MHSAARGCVPSVVCPHLGGEVPVEEALAVQVLQPTGDVQGQAGPHTPGQVHVAAQQLLQVATVDVLDKQTRQLSGCNFCQICDLCLCFGHIGTNMAFFETSTSLKNAALSSFV